MRRYLTNEERDNLISNAATIFVIVGMGAMLYVPIGFAIVDTAKARKEIHTYTTINVSEGNIIIDENSKYQGLQKDNYSIIDYDDDSLVVHVYYEDPAKRFMYKEYIINKINIIENEDGTYSIDFDPSSLSEEGYKYFAENYLGEKRDNGEQRKRG